MSSDARFPPPQVPPSTTAAASFPVKVIIRDAAVISAPPILSPREGKTVTIEGKVIASNPLTQEVRIATKEGEVVIQSAVSLPSGTEVSVEIFTEKARMQATIALLKQQQALTKELQNIVSAPIKTEPAQQPPLQRATPLPPLKTGDIVTALRLSSPPAPPVEAPALESNPIPQISPPPAASTDMPLQEAVKTLQILQKMFVVLPEKPPLLSSVTKESPRPIGTHQPEETQSLKTSAQPVTETILKTAEILNIPVKTLTPLLKKIQTTLPLPEKDFIRIIQSPEPSVELQKLPAEVRQKLIAFLNDPVVQKPLQQISTELQKNTDTLRTGSDITVKTPLQEAQRQPTPQNPVVKPAALTPPTRFALKTAVEILPQVLKSLSIEKLPVPLPLPQADLKYILTDKEPVRALQQLSLPVQEKIVAFISQPDVVRFVLGEKNVDTPSSQPTADKPRPPPVTFALKTAATVLPQILKTIPPVELPRLLPLPPADLKQIAETKDIFKTLQQLPVPSQQKVVDFLTAVHSAAIPKILQEMPPDEVRLTTSRPPAKETPSTRGAPVFAPVTTPDIPSEKPIADIITHVAHSKIPASDPASVSVPMTVPDTPSEKTIIDIITNILHSKIPAPAPAVTADIQQQPAISQKPLQPVADVIKALLPALENVTSLSAENFLPILSTPQTVDAIIKALLPRFPDNMHEVKIVNISPQRPVLLQAQTPDSAPTPALAPKDLPQEQRPHESTPVLLLTGQVESITSDGNPIIRTDTPSQDRFVLKTSAPLPAGHWVTFEAKPMTVEDVITDILPALQSAAAMPSFEPLHATEWPALEEVIQTLNTPATAIVADALRETLPTPNAPARLPPAVLLFLSALRSGSIDGWLGDNILSPLKQGGKKDLLERLTNDFGKISAQAKEPLPDNWKAISLPLLHDDHLSQAQLFVRHQHDQDEKADRRDAQKSITRFILNLHLSRMGDMQLDGLVRKKRFDLVLRTIVPLPVTIRNDLAAGFAKAMTQTDMKGDIAFQIKSKQWVTIDAPAHDGIIA